MSARSVNRFFSLLVLAALLLQPLAATALPEGKQGDKETSGQGNK